LQLKAAKRRENAAHGVSRGLDMQKDEAPEGRKRNCISPEKENISRGDGTPSDSTHIIGFNPPSSCARPDSRGRLSPHESSPHESVLPTHAQLLSGLQINAELIRSRLDRKPARSVTFATKAAWAG